MRFPVTQRYFYSSSLLLAAVFFGGLAQAADDAEAWLGRMQQAVDGINYEGTLVHMTPGRAEQFRVYQRVFEDTVTERLVLVDGMGAEIIRTPDEVICIFPDQRSVVVESRVNAQVGEGPLRANLPSIADLAPAHYDLAVGAEDRVAERNALIILISPKDQYRYGYRLWLDKETAMPLKSQLISSEAAMPLEEMRFVSITLAQTVAEESVRPSIDTSDFSVTHHEKPPERPEINGAVIAWAAENLPPGFMLSASRYEFMEGEADPRMHLVYTDGLASVSVFLDRVSDAAEQKEGLSEMGASNAYTVVTNGLLVTAMGEVPSGTVERIAVSMMPASAAQP